MDKINLAESNIAAKTPEAIMAQKINEIIEFLNDEDTEDLSN
jgi:hypothetical protein